MMDHRLISDALKRRDEQARQAHIALLIRPGLNGRYTFCDSKNNNKHHWKNNGRALIPEAARMSSSNVRGCPRFDNHKEHSERTIVFDYENVDVHGEREDAPWGALPCLHPGSDCGKGALQACVQSVQQCRRSAPSSSDRAVERVSVLQ